MNLQFIKHCYTTAEQKKSRQRTPKQVRLRSTLLLTNDTPRDAIFWLATSYDMPAKRPATQGLHCSWYRASLHRSVKIHANSNGECAIRLAYSRCRYRADYAGSLRNIPDGISVSSFTGSNSKPWGAASRATSSRLTVCHVYSAWLSRTTLPSRTI